MRIGVLVAIACFAVAHASAGPPVRRALLEGAVDDALSSADHARIVARLRTSAAALAPMKAAGVTPLAWPLQPAPSFTPFGYTAVVNFVDHDLRFPGFVRDYTCGTRSYDTAAGYNHGGTDYVMWPFPWWIMDAGNVSVVAAASGTLIEKHDGYFDRDCAINFDTSAAINAVYVRQDDGLTAWYLHMKKGSVTKVPIGSRIAAGDYLGLVGSSGPSSVPHLHFELTDDATGEVVDPRHGTCNAAPDRWIVPQPYEQPRILSLSTHAAEPETVDCGIADGAAVHDEIHALDRFAPGDTVWVFAAFGDHRNGEISEFSLLRPDGSEFAKWTFDLASQHLERPFYSGTAWDWSYALPADAPNGTWAVQATFAGQTWRKTFIVAPAIEPNQRGIGGTWANPQTSGQGFVVDLQPDYYGAGKGLLFGGWFTYAAAAVGGQRWYTLQAQVLAGQSAVETPIYQTTGGAFATAQTTATAPVGVAMLRFDDCAHGELDYRFSDGSARSGTIPLQRLLPNVACGAHGDTGASTQTDLRSGTWADLATSGQGLVLDLDGSQHLLFGAWYTFAPDAGADGGAPTQRWYTLQSVAPDATTIDDIGMYESTGGVFDGAASTTLQAVGSARLHFVDCGSATFDYAFTAGTNAGRNGHLDLRRLGNPPAGCVGD